MVKEAMRIDDIVIDAGPQHLIQPLRAAPGLPGSATSCGDRQYRIGRFRRPPGQIVCRSSMRYQSDRHSGSASHNLLPNAKAARSPQRLKNSFSTRSRSSAASLGRRAHARKGIHLKAWSTENVNGVSSRRATSPTARTARSFGAGKPPRYRRTSARTAPATSPPKSRPG